MDWACLFSSLIDIPERWEIGDQGVFQGPQVTSERLYMVCSNAQVGGMFDCHNPGS